MPQVPNNQFVQPLTKVLTPIEVTFVNNSHGRCPDCQKGRLIGVPRSLAIFKFTCSNPDCMRQFELSLDGHGVHSGIELGDRATRVPPNGSTVPDLVSRSLAMEHNLAHANNDSVKAAIKMGVAIDEARAAQASPRPEPQPEMPDGHSEAGGRRPNRRGDILYNSVFPYAVEVQGRSKHFCPTCQLLSLVQETRHDAGSNAHQFLLRCERRECAQFWTVITVNGLVTEKRLATDGEWRRGFEDRLAELRSPEPPTKSTETPAAPPVAPSGRASRKVSLD